MIKLSSGPNFLMETLQKAQTQEQIAEVLKQAEKINTANHNQIKRLADNLQVTAIKLADIGKSIIEAQQSFNIETQQLFKTVDEKVSCSAPLDKNQLLVKVATTRNNIFQLGKNLTEMHANHSKINQSKIEAEQAAREFETDLFFIKLAAKEAQDKINKQAKLAPQTLSEYLDGKVTILNGQTMPERSISQRIRHRVETFDEIMEHIKRPNSVTLIAEEDKEIVGIFLGEKETLINSETQETSSQLKLINMYFPRTRPISLNNTPMENLKFMLLLEAMKFAQNNKIDSFFVEYEHASISHANGFLRSTLVKPEAKQFALFNTILQGCKADPAINTIETTPSTISKTQNRQMTYSVKELDHGNAKLKLESHVTSAPQPVKYHFNS